MGEKPKQQKPKEIPLPNDSDRDDRSNAVAERSYYYDDAHGYEEFDPENADDQDDETESDEA
jgi:hypothetical protein